MILRPSILIAIIAALLALLAAFALMIPGGGEMLVARASTKASLDPLQACLAQGLGLGAWQGGAPAWYANRIGLRVVINDNGHERQVGLFNDGGKPLSEAQREVLKGCLGGK